MERKDGQGTVYPPEYAHIEAKVRAIQERVQQLDEQIKNVPANSKPAPGLRPPGYLSPRYFSREEKIASLEGEKAELKETIFRQIELELKNADPKVAREVKDTAREELYPNPVRQMSKQEKEQYRGIDKDIQQSQNLMDSLFTAKQKEVVKDDFESQKETLKKEVTSMSLRFSQGLSYNRASEKTDKLPDSPSKDIDLDTLFPSGPAIIEKSSKEPTVLPKANKDMSVMSARFSQGLSYTKVNVKTNRSPDKSPEPDKI